MTEPPIRTEPSIRRDAARNWERIVAVARQVVDEGGPLQLNDVAHRAGVGVATVYRRFPTPEALLETVAMPCLESLIEQGERALTDPDAGKGLADFLGRILQAQIGDASLSLVAAAPTAALPRTAQLKAELSTVGARLLQRAQDAGAVRPDVAQGDLVPLICGLAYATTAHGGDPAGRAATARHYLDLLLAGLGPRASTHD